jgi:hypothetical protein
MGYRSCFFRKKSGSGWKIKAKRIFDPEKVYKNAKH